VKNRKVAHENGVFKWSDPKCTPKNMGIYGKKVAPIVSAILEINRSPDNKIIHPDIIKDNRHDWKNKQELEFYVDFETVNSCFYNKDVNLLDSKTENNVVFLIGVGYEEDNEWHYISFKMKEFTLAEEKKVIGEFVDFMEMKVSEHIKRYNIKSRNLCSPLLFHWGHAERSLFRNCDKRHGNVFTKWEQSITWIDFCKVFQDEPIVVRDAKKFSLKEIAKVMFKHKLIKTCWNVDGFDSGLSVMIDGANFYLFMDAYNKLDGQAKQITKHKADHWMKVFENIIQYNEIDCKVVWEIVNYLRTNNT